MIGVFFATLGTAALIFAMGWGACDLRRRMQFRKIRSNFEPGMLITMGTGETLRVVEVTDSKGTER